MISEVPNLYWNFFWIDKTTIMKNMSKFKSFSIWPRITILKNKMKLYNFCTSSGMGEDKDKNLRLETQYFKAFWVKKSLPRNINCVFKERKSIVSKW